MSLADWVAVLGLALAVVVAIGGYAAARRQRLEKEKLQQQQLMASIEAEQKAQLASWENAAGVRAAYDSVSMTVWVINDTNRPIQDVYIVEGAQITGRRPFLRVRDEVPFRPIFIFTDRSNPLAGKSIIWSDPDGKRFVLPLDQ